MRVGDSVDFFVVAKFAFVIPDKKKNFCCVSETRVGKYLNFFVLCWGNVG